MGISSEELAGLSDEERRALDDDLEAPVVEEASAIDAGEVSGAEDSEEQEATAEQPAGEETVATTETADGDAADAEAAATEPPGDFVPRYEAQQVEDYANKMQALETAEVELRRKLADGDVTIDEYDAEKSRIGKEIRTLELQQHEAEMYAKMNQQVAAQKWQWEQEQFFSGEANKIYDDKLLMAALDTAVKQLANDPQYSTKAGTWFLQEADRMVRERFQQPAAPQSPADGAKPKLVQGRTPDVSKLPKTLANLPTAEIPDTGGDEFSGLDKLSGIELEQRLAKMSPEEVDRYLKVAA